MTAPGIYPDMPDADYRATRAVSCSTLKRFAEAPAKAHVGRPDSTAMAIGRLLHEAVLEAHRFDSLYAVTDLDRRGTKAWQEEEAAAASAGKQLLKRADYDMAMRVRDAAQQHPVARQFLAPGLLTEVSVFWQDADTGLACRGRMDGIRHDMRAIVDVKTTGDASAGEFGRSAARFRFHWQDVFYRAGIAAAPGGFRPEVFVFLAVERDPPHLIAAYEMARPALEVAAYEVREALREYAECQASGIWPGYPEQIITLDLPAWAMGEESIA